MNFSFSDEMRDGTRADEFQSNFGKQGSLYDFDTMDIPAMKEKSIELEAQVAGMNNKKKINTKVINMIDR